MTTFVLVHGAWHDTWCWSRVTEQLARLGHRGVPVHLPSDDPAAGRAEYLDAVTGVLDGLSDVCLVAHSMSGLVAPYALGRPEVSSLVLLASMVPQPGSSFQDQGAQPFAEPMIELNANMTFDASFRSSWRPEDAAKLFYSDVPAAEAASAVQLLRPDATRIYGETAPALPDRRVPTTYVACGADRALSPSWNAGLAEKFLDARVVGFESAHSPFWSHPGGLTDVLVGLAAGRG